MDSDYYEIKVLHFLHPHLIWVQVANNSNDDQVKFEQIGLYGVVPMTPYVADECLLWKHESNSKWQAAVNLIMDKFFKSSSSVWFSLIKIESRTSIFDDNLHAFGEIYINKPDGEIEKLSACLTSRGFGLENESLFLQEFSSGHLHTKLDHLQTKEVVANIESYYTKNVLYNHAKLFVECLKKQTTIFQMAENFHSAMSLQTSESFKGVKLNMSKDEVNKVIKNKLEVFESCKGADDVSVGTANRYKSKTKSMASYLLAQRVKRFKESLKLQREHLLSVLEKPQTESSEEPLNVQKSPETEDKFVASTPRWKQDKRIVVICPAGANLNTLVIRKSATYQQRVQKKTQQDEGMKKTDMSPYNNSDLGVKLNNGDMLNKKTCDKDNVKYERDLSESKASLNNQLERAVIDKQNNALNVVKNVGTDFAKAGPSSLDKLLKMHRAIVSKAEVKNYKAGCDDVKNVDCTINTNTLNINNSVNPFKNANIENIQFFDKFDPPVLMVHCKNNDRIIPRLNIKDTHFNLHIHTTLSEMDIKNPTIVQTVSWHTILRGLSVFMISPPVTGKTMGFLPAVCRLVADGVSGSNSIGPICIILCATSKSVATVENLGKSFLGFGKKVSACYSGLTKSQLTTLQLNECDLLVCTPPSLIQLIFLADTSVDLRRLSIVVFDDYQRLSTVYRDELKVINFKIDEMLNHRACKEWKIQYILSSRVWCESMVGIAKKAPDTVICIGAFQECVLYSKAKPQILIVESDNKINIVLDYLQNVDGLKRTVIACNNENEVKVLEKELLVNKHNVYAWNNTMTNEDSHNHSEGAIFVCCDSNLSKMNVTNAHNLFHYSMPHSFSMFCKRFSVLTDNYASIFKTNDKSIEIKMLIEELNTEQLPKILHFLKRCNGDVPEVLNDISEKILVEQDVAKAKSLAPICGNLLSLGECPNFWDCQQRHTIFKEYDEPKDNIPKEGVITFKILHYHSPVVYSAQLLSNSTVNGVTTKYPETCSSLSLEMGMYYGRMENRQLHGIPIVGDICAVSMNQNIFVRCQVIKIIDYHDGNPNKILVKLLDEEKFDVTNNINLYYLPKELADIDTHVIQVRLVNVHPKDQDITFSKLAEEALRKTTEFEGPFYFRGKIVLAIRNCVFVDSLEVCQDLAVMKKTTVKYDVKKELAPYVVYDSEHFMKLMKLCDSLDICNLYNKKDESSCPEAGSSNIQNVVKTESEPQSIVFEKMSKNRRKFGKSDNWAQLDEDLSNVYFLSAENPSEFYVGLEKYADFLEILNMDIQDYVNNEKLNPIENINTGDIVIAKFEGDSLYYRARIDEILKDKVKCFYVDEGDWGNVPMKYIFSIPDRFVSALPFQAIECRLVGIKPFGEEWTDFAINWFCDRFYEHNQIYVKHFKKTPAVHTGDYRYDVAAVDTHTEKDIVINQELLDLNLAQENEEDINHLKDLKFDTEPEISDAKVDDFKEEKYTDYTPPVQPANTFLKQPIRSVPLVQSDHESDVSDVWDIHASEDFKSIFAPQDVQRSNSYTNANLPAIANATAVEGSKASAESNSTVSSSTIEAKIKDLDKANISDSTSAHQDTLDPDDLTSPEKTNPLSENNHKIQIDLLRKPKIRWLQNKKEVIIKIELIVEKYEIEIKDRYLKFEATANNGKYGFDINLFGLVSPENSFHTNKGLYVRVTLKKYIMLRNWLTLSRDDKMNKWIVYDVESINVSSSEDEEVNKEPLQKTIGNIHYNNSDSENEDDEICVDLDRVHKCRFY